MTFFGISWNSLFQHLTPRYHYNNPDGIQMLTFCNLVGATSSISTSRLRIRSTSPPVITQPCFSKQLPPPAIPTSSLPYSQMLIPSAVGTIERGYERNVPLLRVPRVQSASLMTEPSTRLIPVTHRCHVFPHRAI